MKILFVCRANVGRSQMAEVIFNSLAGNTHRALSAGTVVSKPGQKLKDKEGAENVLIAVREMGLDASENVRTNLTPDMLNTVDKVIVMAEPSTIPEWLSNNKKFVYWEIMDAKGQDVPTTVSIRDQITKKVTELIDSLK